MGDWQAYLREVYQAGMVAVEDPSKGALERLRRSLEGARHLAEYAGFLTPEDPKAGARGRTR